MESTPRTVTELPPLARLPDELKSMVCIYLSKPELKDVRLVSKSFDCITVPFLFDTIYVTFSPFELTIAQCVIDMFAPYVKTLFFCYLYYEELDTDACVRLRENRSFLAATDESEDEQQNAELRQLFVSRHRALRTAQQLALGQGQCQALLSTALKDLPNLHTINIRPRQSARIMVLGADGRVYD